MKMLKIIVLFFSIILPLIMLAQSGQDPITKTQKRYDYLPFYIGSLSTEEILKAMKDGTVLPLSFDEANKRYRGQNGIYKDIPYEEFKEIYRKSMESYALFVKRKNNGFKADRWQYDAPDGLSGDIDLNIPSSGWGEPGYDQFGNMTATPQEVAAAREKANKLQESSLDTELLCKCRFLSYWESHQESCNKEERKAGANLKSFWEKNCNLRYSLTKESFGSNSRKTAILMWDKDNMPYWQAVYVPD